MSYEPVRRSGRLSRRISVILIGSTTKGQVFSETTHTCILSQHGAGILSAHLLAPEQELILRSLESSRETAVRVVGTIGTQEGIHAYGVAFVDEQIDFWNLAFPQYPPSDSYTLPLYLECSLCNAPLLLSKGDFEFDVCAVHGGLVRYCDSCSFSTVWKVAAQRSTPQPTLLISKGEAISSQSPMPVLPRSSAQNSKSRLLTLDPPVAVSVREADRRLHRRVKVNYCACIRSKAFKDDIVNCIDMSRGGVGFKTKNHYLLDAEIRIAVPYSRESPDAPAIFVDAKIATRVVMPDNNFFRCGVAFLPVSS
jgi:PilZ domain